MVLRDYAAVRSNEGNAERRAKYLHSQRVCRERDRLARLFDLNSGRVWESSGQNRKRLLGRKLSVWSKPNSHNIGRKRNHADLCFCGSNFYAVGGNLDIRNVAEVVPSARSKQGWRVENQASEKNYS